MVNYIKFNLTGDTDLKRYIDLVFGSRLEKKMSQSGKIYIYGFLAFFLVLNCQNLRAQKVMRSTGIGIRLGAWKMYDPADDKKFDYATVSTTSGSGEGGVLHFYKRLRDRWFLDGSLGNLGNVSLTRIGTGYVYTANLDITLFQFGARYDWLSPKYGSSFQPYLSLGGGLYWLSESSNLVEGGGVETTNKTTAKAGIYGGGGLNFILARWFSINADLKFHFNDFDFSDRTNGVEYGIGCNFMWGGNQELFRVEDIKLVIKDIYPAYYQFYQSYPIALITIKNTVSYPIEINVISKIENYSEREMESGFIRINKGDKKDIPITALLGPKILYADKREPGVIDIRIEARTGNQQTKSLSVNVTIHSRNAWNGQVDRLPFFLTPEHEDIVRLSRDLVKELAPLQSDVTSKFKTARYIFNALQKMGIKYQSDPNIPFYQDDYVQYADETLSRKTGDCDDLVVLYNSLLESIGIRTAFIDVRDPDEELAHLYMMFDTGLTPEEGYLISSNEKRFIIRGQNSSKKTIWIPVETTLIEEGFEKAWSSGSIAYLKDGEIRNGLLQGWVRIVDIN